MTRIGNSIKSLLRIDYDTVPSFLPASVCDAGYANVDLTFFCINRDKSVDNETFCVSTKSFLDNILLSMIQTRSTMLFPTAFG